MRPPRQSVRQAARTAGISETRWRQIEQGVRHFRGQPWQEPPAPAATLARMALTVGATSGDLSGAGRGDAAAELEAILDQIDSRLHDPGLSLAQRKALADRMLRNARDE